MRSLTASPLACCSLPVVVTARPSASVPKRGTKATHRKRARWSHRRQRKQPRYHCSDQSMHRNAHQRTHEPTSSLALPSTELIWPLVFEGSAIVMIRVEIK